MATPDSASVVCVILRGNRAVRLAAGGTHESAPFRPGKATAAVADLVRGTDATHIAWLDERLAGALLPRVAGWPDLLAHDLELLHSGAQREPRMETLGLVCYADAGLIPAVPGRRIPTHLVGTLAGIAPVALLRAVGLDGRYGSLSAMLSDAAWRGRDHGLLAYQDPRLTAPAADVAVLRPHAVSRGDVAKLIARNLDARWLALWLLGYLRFRWWLPLLAALGTVLSGRRKRPIGSVPDLRALHPGAPDDAFDPARDGADVIIPTLGRPGPLADVLRDLAAQSEVPQRVVVIEQVPGPDWPTIADDVLRHDWPFVLVHRRISETGACLARNLALAECRAPWIAMLDDDVRLDRSWLRACRQLARGYTVDAVCGRVVDDGQSGDRVIRPEPVPDLRVPDAPQVWPTFASGAGFVSAAILADAGGAFDMGLEGGWGEDQEFGVRLRMAGTAIMLEPSLPVLHLKAPMGGFRSPRVHPWSSERIQPRPAPTMMLFNMRHAPPLAQRGYRQFYALGRLLGTPVWRWPLAVFRIRRELRASVRWATWLAERHACPVVKPLGR